MLSPPTDAFSKVVTILALGALSGNACLKLRTVANFEFATG